ncbi:MAG: hypothetical protein WED09_13980 [Homoserinimonas sp.]
MRKPSSGRGWIASVWQTLSVILGAIFFGTGLTSLIIGTNKRRKFGRR